MNRKIKDARFSTSVKAQPVLSCMKSVTEDAGFNRAMIDGGTVKTTAKSWRTRFRPGYS